VRSRKKFLRMCSAGRSTPDGGRAAYPPTSATNSRAALLMENNYPSSVNVPQAPSTFSLDTIDVQGPSRPASAANLKLSPVSATTSGFGDEEHHNAFSFLTSGARAVKPFCRPWPVATTGRVTALDFNLHEAEMKMTLAVKEGMVAKGGECVTEIYLPVVHYASGEFVKDSWGRGGREGVSGGKSEGEEVYVAAAADSEQVELEKRGAVDTARPSFSHTITSEPSTLTMAHQGPTVALLISKSSSTS